MNTRNKYDLIPLDMLIHMSLSYNARMGKNYIIQNPSDPIQAIQQSIRSDPIQAIQQSIHQYSINIPSLPSD
jgi:hypothetical protein